MKEFLQSVNSARREGKIVLLKKKGDCQEGKLELPTGSGTKPIRGKKAKKKRVVRKASTDRDKGERGLQDAIRTQRKGE